jgi:putative membrane protein
MVVTSSTLFFWQKLFKTTRYRCNGHHILAKGVNLQLIKKEFANIFKSKSVMLLLVAVIVIPFVYSFCFLTSAWDPYGHTGQVPVAVVNEDEPATLEGKKVNVGEQTIANLKSNDQLGWHFVSKKAAAQGLKDNKYYTVITIPRNFSRNAATVLQPHPKQMKLSYKTNGSLNYISEVMSQVGADKLNSQIRAKVTNAFASTLFAQVGQIGKQIGKAATGATQLSDGIVTLDNGVNKYTVGVSQVHDGLQTLKVAVKPLSSGVQQLTDGGEQLYNGLGQLNSNVPALTSGVNQLDTGAHQLSSGLGQLHGQIPALTSGVSQLYAGSGQEASGLDNLNGQAPELASGIVQLLAGSGSLTDGLSQLNEKVPALTSGVDQLYDGLTQLNGNMPALASGTKQLDDGGKQLSDGISTLYNSATQDTTNADGTTTPSLVSAIQQLTDGSGTLKDGTSQLKDGVSVLYGQKDVLSSGVQQLDDGVNQYTDGTGQLAAGIKKMYDSKDTLASGVTTLSTNMDKLYKAIKNGTDADTPGLYEAALKLSAGSQQLYDGISQLQDSTNGTAGVGSKPTDGDDTSLTGGVSKLNAKLKKLNDTVNDQITTLNKTVADLNTMKKTAEDKTKTADAAMVTAIGGIADADQKKAVQDAFDQIKSAQSADSNYRLVAGMALSTVQNHMTATGTDSEGDPTGLQSAVSALYTGSQQLDAALNPATGKTGFNDAVSLLQNGSKTLTDSLSKLKTNSLTITLATAGLDGGLSDLDKSVNGGGGVTGENPVASEDSLVGGIEQLNDGAQQLTSNSSTLNSGVDELNNKVNVGSEDTPSLISALGQLNDGTTQLDTGAGTLNAGLVQLNGNVPTLVDGITQLKTGSGSLSTGLDQLYAQINNSTTNADGTTTPSLISAVEQLTDGMSQLHDQTPALASGVSQLYAGSQQINTGLGKINQKTKDLPDGVKKLTSGIHQIKDGLAQLKSKTPALASGVTQLYDGSNQLTGGLDQLSAQTPTLASGVKKLHDGSKQLKEGLEELNSQTPALGSGVTQLADGADQLNSNSPALTSGTKQLKDGSGQLADGLGDGYKQVNGVKLTNLTAKMFAEPSKAVQKRLTTVPNYGDALAPYVLALALFIAIIIFNFSYPMRRHDGYKSVADWFKAKFAVGTLVALAMAIIEATLMLVVGLHVDHIGQFYGMTILFALAAMYMTQFLNLAFGGVGIFVALGLLTMSGSGGLFPAETISPLYESTQRFLPMTYAINGYRNAISSGISASTVASSVAVLVAIAVISVALMFPAIKYLLTKLESEAKE